MKPILKWVGGKRQLINQIINLMPNSYNNYFEPFIGGGALLFNLVPNKAIINDLNYELYNVYTVIKDEEKLKKLITMLKKHEKNHSKDYYYEIREMDRIESFNKLKDFEKAARTIYLNKAGFNGLYRVNSKGEFNVPFGHKEKINTYELNNLLEINEYFRTSNITILNNDFNKAVETATKNDFVYFDPPYDKIKDDSFTTYQKNDFDREDQKRLFKVFDSLSKKGVKVMLSNHNTEFIRNLYKDYNINVVLANRMINSDATKRGKVEEVIITNYEVHNNETKI